jgi:hypothetical protein
MKTKKPVEYRILELRDRWFNVQILVRGWGPFHRIAAWKDCDEDGDVCTDALDPLINRPPQYYASLEAAREAIRKFRRGVIIHEPEKSLFEREVDNFECAQNVFANARAELERNRLTTPADSIAPPSKDQSLRLALKAIRGALFWTREVQSASDNFLRVRFASFADDAIKRADHCIDDAFPEKPAQKKQRKR